MSPHAPPEVTLTARISPSHRRRKSPLPPDHSQATAAEPPSVYRQTTVSPDHCLARPSSRRRRTIASDSPITRSAGLIRCTMVQIGNVGSRRNCQPSFLSSFYSQSVPQTVPQTAKTATELQLRQQKKYVFGHHCFKFLSIYIWISCGYGPLKMGIKREVDETLRPGVYALVDSCSDQDRQYLHTVFGEGPCRNYLAALKQESDLNFKYMKERFRKIKMGQVRV
ncbi:hypothetical protein F2Q69_00030069 [Brassica cretica]|uniref:Nucleolar 27S pre-rRNA processing Urb2/Npa2 C-terminal domain-containing protein n=1 Tax=Brassica cretica TaxID=69181 RepID=A0A8S9S2R2_BRACR|nr:hypothetical protein F2Q69_00030069 [Brassica cretica]